MISDTHKGLDVVTVHVPVANFSSAHCVRHIDFQLRTSERRMLEQVRKALRDINACIRGDRPVCTASHALVWLVEQVSSNVPVEYAEKHRAPN